MAENRRKFDKEFRAGAVRIVHEAGKSVVQMARELGVNEGTLGNWVNLDRQAREGEAPDPVVREAAEEHRQAPGENPRGDRTQPVQRPDRVHQHQDPTDHQNGVRVQVPEALIALSLLSLGGHRPILPGRK